MHAIASIRVYRHIVIVILLMVESYSIKETLNCSITFLIHE